VVQRPAVALVARVGEQVVALAAVALVGEQVVALAAVALVAEHPALVTAVAGQVLSTGQPVHVLTGPTGRCRPCCKASPGVGMAGVWLSLVVGLNWACWSALVRQKAAGCLSAPRFRMTCRACLDQGMHF
jgi:hypothetical protein